MNDDEWKEKLGPEKYRSLREKWTEQPFSGEYYKYDEDGIYHCAGCGAVLFGSDAKFDSGTGWPSFDAASSDAVKLVKDTTLGMTRTEVVCANCGGHLGHLFDDGPTDTGKRFCINSCSLGFEKSDKVYE